MIAEASAETHFDCSAKLRVMTLRSLSLKMISAAGSGHSGVALGFAPVIDALFESALRIAPNWPTWPARDRFILSAGHASALLYATLYVHGFAVDLEDLRSFRQLGSRAPGHPERGCLPGVEMTTGPLGQGVGAAVGIALAQRWSADRFGDLMPYATFCMASDGDLQEGVASEAISLAGALRLGRLVIVHDDNGTQAESSVAQTSRDDIPARFRASGWRVLPPVAASDGVALRAALREARRSVGQPTYLAVRTLIGSGSSVAGTVAAHGAILDPGQIAATLRNIGEPDTTSFAVLDGIAQQRARAQKRGMRRSLAWLGQWDAFRRNQPEMARLLLDELQGRLPDIDLKPGPEPKRHSSVSLRSTSREVVGQLLERIPSLCGGSADLASSTGLDRFHTHDAVTTRAIHFGVREHAMAAAATGLALSAFLPLVSTYLVFTDYMRPAIRLAAMMALRVIYVVTHDSIGVGQDGPTHQPIEQLASLRAMPGLRVVRPADPAELTAAWQLALSGSPQPTMIVLARQAVLALTEDAARRTRLARRGGYVLADGSRESTDAILIATGSEVAVALEVAAQLEHRGVSTRVVSIPSWDEFDRQPLAYRMTVLPPQTRARVAIEAGSPIGWERYVGLDGLTIGLDHYGASGSTEDVYAACDLGRDRILQRILAWLAAQPSAPVAPAGN